MLAIGTDHEDIALSSSPDLGTFLAGLEAVLNNKVLTEAFFELMPFHMRDATIIQAAASKPEHLQKLQELMLLSQKKSMNSDLHDALFGGSAHGR